METDPLTVTFAALADPTRRAILARLAEGEASVTELSRPFAMTLPAISKHLRVLRESGLVRVRGEGTRRLYALDGARLGPAHDWMKAFEPYWERKLDRIRERAERAAREREAAPEKPKAGG